MPVSTKPLPVPNGPKRPVQIRDPEFGRRLTQACDGNPHCPPLHMGRLRWLKEEFDKKGRGTISTETLRKWLLGEMKAQGTNVEILAQALSVDSGWLYTGSDFNLTPRELKTRNATVNGAVNVVVGLIQMDGGHPAFPDADDRRAMHDAVDLYAIIKGANYAFQVVLADTVDGNWRFAVSPKHERAIVLGLIRDGFAFRVVEIPGDLIDERGNRRGPVIEVLMTEAEIAGREVTGFDRRL